MLTRSTLTPDALRFMCQEHEHLNSDAKALLDRAAVEIESLRGALEEIASGLSVRNPFHIANEALGSAVTE